MKQVLLCSMLVVVFCACRTSAPKHPAAVAQKLATNAFTSVTPTSSIQEEMLKPSPDYFRLGPGDVVEIETIGGREGPASATVGPDGKIYYSLLPGLFVWGLSLSEARQLVEENLAKFLRERPEIGLTLKTVGSRRIWLLGNVGTPGVYSLATPTTLLEAIALAGGVAQAGGVSSADLTRSFVLRNGKPLPVDFRKLLYEGDLSQNIYLQPDDFVYFRPSVTADVYVMGAVPTPSVVPFSKEMSLASAIAYSGGPGPYASLSQVAILRGSLTSPSIATVNFHDVLEGKSPDVQLEPGDLVFVPRSPFVRLEIFVDSIVTTFVHTVAVNEGRRAVSDVGPVGTSISSQ